MSLFDPSGPLVRRWPYEIDGSPPYGAPGCDLIVFGRTDFYSCAIELVNRA